MTQKKGGDPVQKTIATLEERVNELGKAVFGSENFGKVMNSAVTSQAGIQKRFSNRMAKNLHFYNMPSQEDIVQLAEQCGRIEERMIAIESLLHDALGKKTSGTRKGPARTKQPKSSTRAKTRD